MHVMYTPKHKFINKEGKNLTMGTINDSSRKPAANTAAHWTHTDKGKEWGIGAKGKEKKVH